MSRFPIAVTLIAASLAACDSPPPPIAQPRLVRAATVRPDGGGETVSMTGQIRAKDQANLGFRIDGRMVERLVNAGDGVKAGQVIARLAAQDQQNARRSVEAGLAAAAAQLTQARLALGRQQQLFKDGWTPRARLDDAEQAFQAAQAQVESARAQLRLAHDTLGYTLLAADSPGVVTAVGAEPGEVVRAGQMVVQLARESGLDAVFDVPEQIVRNGPRDPVVELALPNDPLVTATGRVREVAPQADPITRTFRAKVAITEPPAAMRLGSTITGRIRLAPSGGVTVPASAITEADGRPAVWTVDIQSQTVSLRSVEVLRYDPSEVVVAQGVKAGEVVVTAGVQLLHPGQKVRVQEAAR
jgi:RND family efflux transporter MFP subunit